MTGAANDVWIIGKKEKMEGGGGLERWTVAKKEKIEKITTEWGKHWVKNIERLWEEG